MHSSLKVTFLLFVFLSLSTLAHMWTFPERNKANPSGVSIYNYHQNTLHRLPPPFSCGLCHILSMGHVGLDAALCCYDL